MSSERTMVTGKILKFPGDAVKKIRPLIEAGEYEEAARSVVSRYVLKSDEAEFSDRMPSIAVAGVSRVGKSSLAECFRQIGYSIIPTDGLRRFYWSKEQGHSFVSDLKECRRVFYTQCFEAVPTGICLEGDDFWHHAATRYKEQVREAGGSGALRSWDKDTEVPLILLGIQEKDIQRKAEQIREYAEKNGDLENQDLSMALNKATKMAAARPLMCEIAEAADNVMYFDTFSDDDPVKRIKEIFLEACKTFGVINP